MVKMTRSKTFQAYLPSCHRTYSCIHCRAHLANHDELISKVTWPVTALKLCVREILSLLERVPPPPSSFEKTVLASVCLALYALDSCGIDQGSGVKPVAGEFGVCWCWDEGVRQLREESQEGKRLATQRSRKTGF